MWNLQNTKTIMCVGTFSISIICRYIFLSRLQLASANRVKALTSRDSILWVQGVPNVKNQQRESIEMPIIG